MDGIGGDQDGRWGHGLATDGLLDSILIALTSDVS